MSLRDSLTLLRQFARFPTAVGAVAPSSRALAHAMVQWFDWPHIRAVAEYGPGTGVFTQAILTRVQPETRFLAIEINSRLADLLQSRWPGVAIYHDSACNVAKLCRREGIEQLDAIVCGLPWASLSDATQTELLDATAGILRDGGQFATFAYLQGLLLPAGQRFRRKLHAYFRSIDRSRTVWANVPPALIYRCRK
jgi:phospholipid N-methyltransferase